MACPFQNADNTIQLFLGPGSFVINTLEESRTDALAIVNSEILSINEAIQKLHHVLRVHKTIYNDLISISRLPREVLTIVFSMLDLSSPSWLRVTHVCSLWRKTAIEARHLWTRPFFHSFACAEEMIARAGSLPLQVEIGSSPRSSFPWTPAYVDEVTSLAVPQAGRLLLNDEGNTCSWVRTENRLVHCFEVPENAKFLKELIIRSPSQAPGTLPYNFFGEKLHAPALQDINFHNWTVDWFNLVTNCSKIVSLEIVLEDPRHASAQYAISEVAPFLAKLRCLKKLVLSNIFREVTQTDEIWFSRSPERIVLPQLRHLSLTTSAVACDLIFSKLYWPPCLSARVDVRDPPSTPRSVAAAIANSQTQIRRLMRTISEKLPFSIRGLSFSSPSLERYLITIRDKDTVWRHEADNAQVRIEIPYIPNVTSNVGYPLALTSLERVGFFVNSVDSEFLESMGKLKAIRSLVLSSRGKDFLMLFSHFVPVDSGTSPQNSHQASAAKTPAYFPALAALSIHNWEFRLGEPREANPRAPLLALEEPVDFDAFSACLRLRRESGYRLKLVKFTRCKGVTSGRIEQLKGLGLNVVVIA